MDILPVAIKEGRMIRCSPLSLFFSHGAEVSSGDAVRLARHPGWNNIRKNIDIIRPSSLLSQVRQHGWIL
jgi:hypothetical protein